MATISISLSQIANAPIADACYQINQALFSAQDGDTIQLEQGDYPLRRAYAFEKFCYISNNDAGMKRIAFPVIGKKNLTIDGGGATLNGIGRVLPFYLLDCEHITLQNFTIDYVRPFFTQGTILEGDAQSVLLSIDTNEFPYMVKDNVPIFTGEDYQSYFVHGLLEYEPDTKRPIKNVFDSTLKTGISCKEEGEGKLRLFSTFKTIPTAGNIMTIKHEERFVPAIAISNCKHIALKQITIHQAGTMGVVAQFSENILLDGVNVVTRDDSPRVVSVDADATHFVNCRGAVTVQNGIFESQLDDVINVHGNYLRVVQAFDDTHILVEIPHFQQVGAFSLIDGANLTICDQPSLMPVGTSKLASSETINSRCYLLTLAEPFAFEAGKTYCVDDTDAYPEVVFHHNRCGKNRARGLLLTSTKKMTITDNFIDAEGSCIKVNSDMHFWYESGAISELVIRGNTMKRHNFANWGEAILDIDPGMEQEVEGAYFHGNILVEQNTIELQDTPFAFGYSFESLTVRDNTFVVHDPAITSDETLPMRLHNYGATRVERNQYQLHAKRHDV